MLIFKSKPFAELNTHELYAIIQLRLEVFVMEQNCFYQDCDSKDLKAIHLMGFKEEVLVAYCRILPEWVSYKDNCSIGRVLTKSTIRGQSYGKVLMQHAIECCRKAFNSGIRISAQAYLEKFYCDLGFVKITEVYLEDGIEHVGMVHNN
jgi:ElaA protein